VGAIERLAIPLYSVGEAARLLEVPQQKLRRWLDGATVQGVQYAPVIRLESSGDDVVTWAEFVEAGFLRGYRAKKVSLPRLRQFIDAMRTAENVVHPLAQFRPLVLRPRQELLVALNRLQMDIDEGLSLVEHRSGQMSFGPVLRDFLEHVEFDGQGVAECMYPLGRDEPRVVINPEITFGIPQVRGIRTETVAEAVAAGEPIASVGESFALSPEEVSAALRWELRLIGKGAKAA